MNIQQIIDKIDEYQLFVPAFQREYVWKKQDAKDLFQSLIKQYPTGTLLTWETSEPPELKGPKAYNPNMGAVKLILDGQQRITTMYMIITGRIPPYYKEEEILNNIREPKLCVNLDTLELEYYKKNRMLNEPLWVGLTDIFAKRVRRRDIVRSLREKAADNDQEISDDLEDRIEDNLSTITNILDREFPEQIIPVKAKLHEAIDIFYIVNASGINLTEAELALAQISGYWPKARELFKKKLLQLASDGFVFKLDFIVYCLLAMTYSLGSDMRKLHSDANLESLKTAWQALDERILDYVVNLLRTHAFVDHSDEINSVFALIPIVAFIHKKNGEHLTEDEIKKTVKWFYYSQIWQRYISQTPQKLDKDLGIVRDNDDPFNALTAQIKSDRTSLEITTSDFVGRDVRHPLFSLMRWYFKSKGAVCFTTGVGLHKNMGKIYGLEKDHIFPYSALRDNGYDMNNRLKYALAQEITNRAILTQFANRNKSDTAAFDYLKEIKVRSPKALEKQCIPDDEQLWNLDRYEEFLSERRELLTNRLNAYLENLTSIDADNATVSWEDIISEGEHDRLEMKETLRWDVERGRVNKDLESVILKTISAFNNAEGGTLVIGVSDDLEVKGLERDYSTLKEGTKDEFELHLKALIHREWGVRFGASKTKITFPVVSGLEFCAIEIEKGDEPLYLTSRDKNGQKSQKFYVRSGNSSPPIQNPKEIAEYVARQFPRLSS